MFLATGGDAWLRPCCDCGCARAVTVAAPVPAPVRVPGLMIDAGRRFFPVPLVQNLLDTMAGAKMNVLHLHGNVRHQFGPAFAKFLAPPHPIRAVCHALLGARADLVLVGAWNPTL